MIRDTIKAAQITAMKAGEKDRLAAVRLILAKIKDRDIELRTASQQPDDDALVVEVLQKMVKQRKDSLEIYTKQSRADLAQKEQEEIAIIEKFLPKQLDEGQLKEALAKIIEAVGAASPADMGKVMGVATKQLAGKADGKAISAMVKALLSGQ